MRLAMISPISWRTPPRSYGPVESVVSVLTEGLVEAGIDVTLFATADSITRARLAGPCPGPCSEGGGFDPKVWECLHISEVFERADEFDLIHNHLGFLPLTYSAMTQIPILSSIHGSPSPAALPVYKKYNGRTRYVASCEAYKSRELDYAATIHPGVDLNRFSYNEKPGDYLLCYGRIHPEKGILEAIDVARKAGMRLKIAGIVQDEEYYQTKVKPLIDGDRVEYLGAVEPEQRAALLGGARALLNLVNFDGPFGLGMMEAMACGTPVIANAKGSIPEIVQDGASGFLVHDVDGAVEAARGIGAIDRGACRKGVEERFAAGRMVEEYIGLYQKILDGRENHRPWGHYENLSEREDHKVKRIQVAPGKRLSLQKHKRRAEHWVVISGEAVMTLDDKEYTLKAGQSVDIPQGAAHRIMNPGAVPLVFVEAQMGDYFGEDDIIRLEDDYGRAK